MSKINSESESGADMTAASANGEDLPFGDDADQSDLLSETESGAIGDGDNSEDPVS